MCQELVPMPIQLIKNINVILASCHTVLSPHFFFESFIWYSLICSCWRYRISYQISFIRNVKNLFWPAHVLYLPQSWAFPSRFISPLYSLPTQPPLHHYCKRLSFDFGEERGKPPFIMRLMTARTNGSFLSLLILLSEKGRVGRVLGARLVF